MPQNESDVMLRMRVLAGEIYTQRVYADYILRQMFPSTAVGEYLDAHAAQRGLTRKVGTKAVGRALFYAPAEEHDDVLIPAGTVVSTADGLRFVADSDTILHDGDLAVTVNVTAAHPGSAYNIIGNRLTVMVTPVMGIESVRNTVSFSGGTDDESDEQLRERIADSFRNISNGANAAYYHSVAMSVDGVYTASVEGASVTLDKLRDVQAALDEKREVNVDVRAVRATAMSVNLYIRLTAAEGYDFDTVAEKVQAAVTDYINALGVGKDLWLSEVGEVIYHIEGVESYKFLETYGSDREVPPSRYALAGNILVRAE